MSWSVIGKYLIDYGVLGIIGYFFLKNANSQQEMVKNLFEDTIKKNQEILTDIQKNMIKSESRSQDLLEQLKEIKIGFQGINESVVGLYTINNENTITIKDYLNKKKAYDLVESKKIIYKYISSTITRIFIEMYFKVDRNNLVKDVDNIMEEIKNIIDLEVNKGRGQLKELNLNNKNLSQLFEHTEKMKSGSIEVIQKEFKRTINNLVPLEQKSDNCANIEELREVYKDIKFEYDDLKRRLWSIAQSQKNQIQSGVDKIKE